MPGEAAAEVAAQRHLAVDDAHRVVPDRRQREAPEDHGEQSAEPEHDLRRPLAQQLRGVRGVVREDQARRHREHQPRAGQPGERVAADVQDHRQAGDRDERRDPDRALLPVAPQHPRVEGDQERRHVLDHQHEADVDARDRLGIRPLHQREPGNAEERQLEQLAPAEPQVVAVLDERPREQHQHHAQQAAGDDVTRRQAAVDQNDGDGPVGGEEQRSERDHGVAGAHVEPILPRRRPLAGGCGRRLGDGGKS